MLIFNTDLDNTLIYSYKHDIGDEKIEVEEYNGRNISYMTNASYDMLKQLKEKAIIVPTTTRTQEQYERIDLKVGKFEYALVCNGGILLENGIRNEKWIANTRVMIEKSINELEKAIQLLENESRRKFEVRFIEEMFVFTKCSEPENVVEDIYRLLDNSKVDVFNNGEKIYVVPKNLDKGTAILRMKEYLGADRIIAAGDSRFDVSMVANADVGIVPKNFVSEYNAGGNLHEVDGSGIFSDEMLRKVLEAI